MNSLAASSRCDIGEVEWGERLFEAGRLSTFSAFRMGAYSRGALNRGWALIRINTLLFNLTNSSNSQFNFMKANK